MRGVLLAILVLAEGVSSLGDVDLTRRSVVRTKGMLSNDGSTSRVIAGRGKEMDDGSTMDDDADGSSRWGERNSGRDTIPF